MLLLKNIVSKLSNILHYFTNINAFAAKIVSIKIRFSKKSIKIERFF